MVWVRTGVVFGLMATGTGIWSIDKIAVVASVAVGSNWDMRSGERIDGAVVKRGRCPGAFAVTTLTIGWKLAGSVIGVSRCGIIGLVATHTGIGRIGVIAIVTSRTVVGNRSVRSIQSIKIVVDWERRRIPSGRSGMAHFTIRGQA